MADIEGQLIQGRPPRYVQLATAAAPEGTASLARWHDLGRAQADRLGVEAVIVDVRTRDDAEAPEMADLVTGAGLVYLSGGSPPYLAQTLRGTRVWAAILAAWESGAALAGCSAGAMALTGWVPAVRDPTREPDSGLGLLAQLRVIPHFDRMLGWVPDLVTRALTQLQDDVVVLGIDEETALVGGPQKWQVHGRQSVWVIGETTRREYPPGTSVLTPGDQSS